MFGFPLDYELRFERPDGRLSIIMYLQAGHASDYDTIIRKYDSYK